MDQTTITLDVPAQVHVVFDSASSHFSCDQEVNRLFLLSVQNHMNDRLRARGVVFLNEVFEQLGLPLTRGGQLLGWTIGGYLDFGIFEGARMLESSGRVSLSLNVDGVVIDALY